MIGPFSCCLHDTRLLVSFSVILSTSEAHRKYQQPPQLQPQQQPQPQKPQPQPKPQPEPQSQQHIFLESNN